MVCLDSPLYKLFSVVCAAEVQSENKKKGLHNFYIYVFLRTFFSPVPACVEISLVVLVAAVLLCVVLVLEVCGNVIVTNV